MSTCRKCSMLTLAIHAWRRRAEERQETIDRQAEQLATKDDELRREKLLSNHYKTHFEGCKDHIQLYHDALKVIVPESQHYLLGSYAFDKCLADQIKSSINTAEKE